MLHYPLAHVARWRGNALILVVLGRAVQGPALCCCLCPAQHVKRRQIKHAVQSALPHVHAWQAKADAGGTDVPLHCPRRAAWELPWLAVRWRAMRPEAVPVCGLKETHQYHSASWARGVTKECDPLAILSATVPDQMHAPTLRVVVLDTHAAN